MLFLVVVYVLILWYVLWMIRDIVRKMRFEKWAKV